MLYRLLASIISISAALVSASTAQDQTNDKASESPTAVIENSGSTNTPGYRLTVNASGAAEWTVSRRRYSPACSTGKGQLSSELTQRFFHDLRDLMPLSKLPLGHCAKSVSFGTTLRATYDGSISPDLTCPADGNQTDKLLNDLAEINKALGVSISPNGLPAACEQAMPAPK